MPFPSPQEHHLTLKCFISPLRWRACEWGPCSLCDHVTLTGRHIPPAYWRPSSMGTLGPKSSQEVVPIKNRFLVLKFSQHASDLLFFFSFKNLYCEIFTFSITEEHIKWPTQTKTWFKCYLNWKGTVIHDSLLVNIKINKNWVCFYV